MQLNPSHCFRAVVLFWETATKPSSNTSTRLSTHKKLSRKAAQCQRNEKRPSRWRNAVGHWGRSVQYSPLLVTLFFLLLLFPSITTASPLPQAVPDRTGNTGSRIGFPCEEPCDARGNSTLSSTTSTLDLVPVATASVAAEPTATLDGGTTAAPIATSFPTTAIPRPISTPTPRPNSQSPDQMPGLPQGLTITTPKNLLSAGAIAGIAAGAVGLVLIVVLLGVCLYRGHRIDVKEISIRRSKLGSRLGFRILGNNSDNGGEAGRKTPMRENEDRREMGRGSPEPSAWVEDGLLAAPKPTYLAKEETDTAAPWVDKGTIGRPKINSTGFGLPYENKSEDSDEGTWKGRRKEKKQRSDTFDKLMISAPRPARPASAEPLGRLSGIGMGMGYLK